MKSERKAVLMAIAENIEMDLFSSEETCMVVKIEQKEEELNFHQRHAEHPLTADSEEEPELQVQTQPEQQVRPKTEPRAQVEAKVEAKHVPTAPEFTEEVEIEMEVFPPPRVGKHELVGLKSDDPSIRIPPSPNKAHRVRWKRLTPQKTGLEVRDVVCLPRGHNLAQPERHIVPRGKERARMTARITIDYGWSANQMQSRLVMLFRGQFAKQAGQRFSFTYLQCVQGSRVLFVPDAPAEGWTGEQVLRISGNSGLYILSHQEGPQTESESSANETPAVNRKELYLEVNVGSCLDEDQQLRRHSQPDEVSNTEECTGMDTILRHPENANGDVETQIHVRRSLLHSALKEVRKPGFCFRTAPLISFSREEADRHNGPLREFFRLTLLELQGSSVFEGLPGCLVLTYDLTALEDMKYYEAGVLIGWSLSHGGPGPRCLHPALYQLMCGQNPPLEDFSWSDVVDAETQIRLQQVHSCTDMKLLSPSLCDWVSSCGIPGIYSANSDEIPAIYSSLVEHYIFHRVSTMISQFKEGMNSCGGLWDTIESHWEAFVTVMTSARQQPLTLEQFKQLFVFCYSCAGGELRAAEEVTAGHWEAALILVSDGRADFSFEDLLAFVTGGDHVPPLGLPSLISLHFYAQEENIPAVRLPYSSTCALELFLPRGTTGAADLLMLLSRAVHEALSFTHLQTEEGEKEWHTSDGKFMK